MKKNIHLFILIIFTCLSLCSCSKEEETALVPGIWRCEITYPEGVCSKVTTYLSLSESGNAALFELEYFRDVVMDDKIIKMGGHISRILGGWNLAKNQRFNIAGISGCQFYFWGSREDFNISKLTKDDFYLTIKVPDGYKDSHYPTKDTEGYAHYDFKRSSQSELETEIAALQALNKEIYQSQE